MRMDITARVGALTDLRVSQAADHKVYKKHAEELMKFVL